MFTDIHEIQETFDRLNNCYIHDSTSSFVNTWVYEKKVQRERDESIPETQYQRRDIKRRERESRVKSRERESRERENEDWLSTSDLNSLRELLSRLRCGRIRTQQGCRRFLCK